MGSSSENGSIPAIISYNKIPKVHQSTGFPCPIYIYIYIYYTHIPLFMSISGAKYSGVPHKVYVLLVTIFANPKSVSFI